LICLGLGGCYITNDSGVVVNKFRLLSGAYYSTNSPN
jgi:hypothetical protein